MELDRRLADLSDQDLSALEAWVSEFDQRWVMGWLPEKASQIPPSSLWRLPALREMVKIDLDRQWKRGNRLSLESYLGQYPELGNAADVSADLIQAEYEVRKQHGEAVDLDEYARRFPEQVGELRRLIASGRSSLATGPKSSTGGRKRSIGDSHRELPEEFGRYRIIRRLGAGGMGSVYLAEDTLLTRNVALKVAHIADDEGGQILERFRREAMAAAGLDHPCLCKLYDVGEVDGVHYLTMEYVEGTTLADLIDGRKNLSGRQVAAIVGKLAVGLQAAHDRGVVHRDLKPANVMIKKAGQKAPVIVDFGLARTVNADGMRLTQTGQAMGTPHYMAVEQIRGELDAIGPASDIYALGVILYELLTGEVPFQGPNPMVVVAKILTVPAPPPSSHRPGLDPRLEAICLKAMAKEIPDRYASMADLASALTAYLKAPETGDSSVEPKSNPRPSASRQGSDTLMGRLLDKLEGEDAASPIIPETEATDGATTRQRRRLLIVGVASFALIFAGLNLLNWGRARKKPAPGSPGVVAETPGVKKVVDPAPPQVIIAPEPPAKVVDDSESFKTIVSPSTGMKLVLVPAGSFQMGSSASRNSSTAIEVPNHPVRITRPFYLGESEVTRGQFRKILDATGLTTEAERNGEGGMALKNQEVFERDRSLTWRSPGIEQNDDHPVVQVCWLDALRYCNALSRKDGLSPFYRLDGSLATVTDWAGEGYRLPTEAEWEYACRAGSTTQYGFGDDINVADDHAWYGEGRYSSTHPVALKQPNAFGLHDMHGNVWEWVWDTFDPDYYKNSPRADPTGPPRGRQQLDRGGGWYAVPLTMRSAFRCPLSTLYRANDLGFRVVRGFSGPSENATTVATSKRPIRSYPVNVIWDGAWRIDGDEVVVERKVTHSGIQVVTEPISLENFGFEAEVKRVEGNGFIELNFGNETSTTLGIEVVGNRTRTHVRHWKNGVMTDSPAPRPMGLVDNNVWDHLRIEKTGRTVVYYVNHKEAGRESDVAIEKGMLMAMTVQANARFRNIKAWRPGGEVLVEGLPDLPTLGKEK